MDFLFRRRPARLKELLTCTYAVLQLMRQPEFAATRFECGGSNRGLDNFSQYSVARFTGK